MQAAANYYVMVTHKSIFRYYTDEYKQHTNLQRKVASFYDRYVSLFLVFKDIYILLNLRSSI